MTSHHEHREHFRATWQRTFNENLSVEAAELEFRELTIFLDWLRGAPAPELSTDRGLTDRRPASFNEKKNH